ncbi:MAG: hypothetical protein ACREN5_06960 [Gemmatimonadales bacterium]
MRKAIMIGAVLAAFVLPATGARADVQVKFYVGAVGDLTILCPLAGTAVEPEVGIGGNCFDVPPGSELLSIRVMDHLAGDGVGFQLGWYNEAMNRLGSFAPGCGSTVAPVPLGAVQLRVFIDGPINASVDCGVEAPGGLGILGSISVVPAQAPR